MKLFKNKGFTLIEILLVIAIISFIITFAIPWYRPVLEESRLEQAVQQLHADLSYARQLARTYGDSQVDFNIDEKDYEISAGEYVYLIRELPVDVAFGEIMQNDLAVDVITFCYGKPKDGNVDISLIGTDNSRASLEISAGTGRVDINYD